MIVAGAITLGRTRADPHRWPFLLLALLVGFDAFCLVDIARAAEVRYLRKRTWALICLIQIPLGGILYLSIGRIGPARPVPPAARSHDRARPAHQAVRPGDRGG